HIALCSSRLRFPIAMKNTLVRIIFPVDLLPPSLTHPLRDFHHGRLADVASFLHALLGAGTERFRFWLPFGKLGCLGGRS
ncbi:MAG TPA: hypothetical protein VNM15_01560, partial [Candidatus Binatia bacterium]|nr:hypothetical protein [Candidatus Binatia bacterium]